MIIDLTTFKIVFILLIIIGTGDEHISTFLLLCSLSHCFSLFSIVFLIYIALAQRVTHRKCSFIEIFSIPVTRLIAWLWKSIHSLGSITLFNKRVIFRETITKRGTHWNLKQVPAHVIFPPEAVSMDSDFTLGRWRPQARSPPLNNNEAIVSDVIELSADSLEGLHFNRAVTLVISHCASDLKGYEIVVKCLIDRASNEWVDLPETVHLRSLAGNIVFH